MADPRPVTELAGALATPPAALTADCPTPLDLPDSALSAGAVERAWGSDRAALASCGLRHSALAEFYRRRDAGLAGAKP